MADYKRNICIVLVDIRSSHNVGSIIRSADGFSAEVILIGITPRPTGGKNDTRLPYIAQKAHKAISKTALGAESSIRWRYFNDFEEAYDTLKVENYTVLAIEQNEDSNDIRNIDKKSPVALVVGAEVEGLPKDIINVCDGVFEIPMTGGKESFNVSVAAAISLYQARLL